MSDAAVSKRELLHLELLRVLAVYLVLFNHSGEAGFAYFTIAETPWGRRLSLFFSLFDKIAVPLFLMISGALLLGKTESIARLLRRRVLKFTLSLMAFTGLYIFFFHWIDGEPLSFPVYFANLYSRGATLSSWYFYIYLAFLLLLPLLRPLAQNLKAEHFWYLAALQIGFCGLVPIAERLFSDSVFPLNTNFSLPLVSLIVFYPLMGYYLERVLDIRKVTGRVLLVLALLSAAGLILAGAAAAREMEAAGEMCQTYFSSMAALPTITVYLLCKKLFSKNPLTGRPAQLLRLAGSASFGIYFFDPILRTVTRPVYQAFIPYIGILPAAFVWLSTALLLGIFAVTLLKKIPGIRYLL